MQELCIGQSSRITTQTPIYTAFRGIYQPAIWVNKSTQVVVVPGAGIVRIDFACHRIHFSHEAKLTMLSYYLMCKDVLEGGSMLAKQSASSLHSISFYQG